MVSTTGGRAGGGVGRAVVLVRYWPTTGAVEDEAHLLPLPLRSADDQPGVISTVCGRGLHVDHLETVRPGRGPWCTPCFVGHVTGSYSTSAPGTSTPATSGAETDTVAGRLAAGVAYQRLGWPVTVRRREVTIDLDLDVDAVALIIPTALATDVADMLTRRRCPPPVLAHPAMPAHRVLVAGERYPVPLGRPAGVYRTTGIMLLPPTVTDRGPVSWVRPPQPDALRLCREIDVIAALRAALNPPPDAANT